MSSKSFRIEILDIKYKKIDDCGDNRPASRQMATVLHETDTLEQFQSTQGEFSMKLTRKVAMYREPTAQTGTDFRLSL